MYTNTHGEVVIRQQNISENLDQDPLIVIPRERVRDVIAALKKADFNSPRGGFKFNVNGYPIQDFYLTKVAKRPDGKFQTEIVEKVFENYGDRYAKDCAPSN